MEPESSTLQGRFLTNRPPRKSPMCVISQLKKKKKKTLPLNHTLVSTIEILGPSCQQFKSSLSDSNTLPELRIPVLCRKRRKLTHQRRVTWSRRSCWTWDQKGSRWQIVLGLAGRQVELYLKNNEKHWRVVGSERTCAGVQLVCASAAYSQHACWCSLSI